MEQEGNDDDVSSKPKNDEIAENDLSQVEEHCEDQEIKHLRENHIEDQVAELSTTNKARSTDITEKNMIEPLTPMLIVALFHYHDISQVLCNS